MADGEDVSPAIRLPDDTVVATAIQLPASPPSARSRQRADIHLPSTRRRRSDRHFDSVRYFPATANTPAITAVVTPMSWTSVPTTAPPPSRPSRLSVPAPLIRLLRTKPTRTNNPK